VVLSKRERYIGIATGLILGLLLLLKVVIDPLLDQSSVLSSQIVGAENDVKKGTDLITLSARANQNWTTLAGQVRKDASEAQSQLERNVRDWAAESGVSLASIKPERSEKEKDFFKLTFRATCTGSMSQVGRFLYRIQTATMPVRITELSLNSRKDGSDDLSLSVAIATIYLGTPDAPRSVASAHAGGGEEMQ
jgi:hypothetical protein